MTDRAHVAIAVIGMFQSGKSTTCGRLLYELGGISERDLARLKQVAIKYATESSKYAYFMYTTPDEKVADSTINFHNHRELFTDSFHYTIIDVPGYTKFIKNMIRGASQADIAMLIVPANQGLLR